MSIQFSTVLRYSSLGRPRRVTHAMIADILAWHDQRLTAREKAISLGVSVSTLHNIVRTAGQHYKQASPEQRQQVLHRNATHRKELLVANLI
jgi:hypothetical protein